MKSTAVALQCSDAEALEVVQHLNQIFFPVAICLTGEENEPLLVSYDVRAMFLAKIARPFPCYGCRNLILFQQELSYNRENTVGATIVGRCGLTSRF